MVLNIDPIQQEHSYSCVAAVYQMVHKYYTGNLVKHDRAMKIVGCDEDGAELEAINKAMGIRVKKKTKITKKIILEEIKRKFPIICDDNLTYVDSHAILIVGATDKRVYINDPSTGKRHTKTYDWIQKTVQEFWC